MDDRAVILFDGVCRFCNGSVNMVIRHDGKDRFRFAPLQSETGQSLLRQHGIDPANTDSFVLIAGQKAFVKSSAALRVARGLGFPWSLLWTFIIVPPFIRNAVYDWIARNRYRWFGKMDACMVPDARSGEVSVIHLILIVKPCSSEDRAFSWQYSRIVNKEKPVRGVPGRAYICAIYCYLFAGSRSCGCCCGGCGFHVEQFHVENQDAVRLDEGAGAVQAVSEGRRDHDRGFGAYFQLSQRIVPSRNHAAFAYVEFQGSSGMPGRRVLSVLESNLVPSRSLPV